MTWGADTNATQLTSITTEQFFDVTPTGDAQHEFWQIQVSVDFPTTPVDAAVISVYQTLDDSTQLFDATPFMEIVVANSPDPNVVTFFVTGYSFRVGVQRDGATDTLTSADLSFREKTSAA